MPTSGRWRVASPSVLGVLLAALSSVSYGASDFTGAYASKSTESAVVTVMAQIVSLLTLCVVLVVMPPDSWSLVDLAWGGAGGVAVAVALTSFYKALAIGPMSTAAATTALVGAVVPFGAGLAFGERPSGLTLVGIAVAVPAVVLVSLGSDRSTRSSSLLTPRDRATLAASAAVTRQLSLLAGLGFGLFFVTLSRTDPGSGLMPLLGARGMSILSLALVLTIGRSWSPVARPSVPFVVVTGVLDCAANALYLSALENGQLTWVAAVTSLYPVTTVLLARLVLGEKLRPVQAAGLLLAGGALSLVAIGR